MFTIPNTKYQDYVCSPGVSVNRNYMTENHYLESTQQFDTVRRGPSVRLMISNSTNKTRWIGIVSLLFTQHFSKHQGTVPKEMKSTNCNTRKGEIMSFKKKFKLFTEISILLPAENTNYYCFTCTQHMCSCLGKKIWLPKTLPFSSVNALLRSTSVCPQNYGHTEPHCCARNLAFKREI